MSTVCGGPRLAIRLAGRPGRVGASGPARDGSGQLRPSLGHVSVFSRSQVKTLAVAEDDPPKVKRIQRPLFRGGGEQETNLPQRRREAATAAVPEPEMGNSPRDGLGFNEGATHQYNVSLEVAAADGKFKTAMLIYNEMRRNNVPPNSITFACLLRAVKKYWAKSKRGKNERAENATRVWKLMQGVGVRPTTTVYNELINCYGRSGRWQLSQLAFESMGDAGCVPDEKTYNSLISAYGRAGRWQDALTMFRRLKDDGHTPSWISYSAIITALKQSGQQEAVIDLLEEMEERGFNHDCHANLKPAVALIRTADSAHIVLQVVRERRREFQHDSIAVAFNRIAHLLMDNTWSIGAASYEELGRGMGRAPMEGSWDRHVAGVEKEKAEVLGSPEFGLLVGLASSKLDGFSPLSLANLAWALGRLQHRPADGGDMLARLAAECRRKMPASEHAELTMMVWGFAMLGVSPGNALVAGLWRSAGRNLDHLDAQALSNVLWASAVLRHDPGRELMEAWMEAMPRVIKYANAFDIGNFLWGCATLGHKPSADLVRLLLGRVELIADSSPPTALSAGELAGMLWSLAVLDVRYEGLDATRGRLLEALGARLEEGWDGLSEEQLGQLHLALQALPPSNELLLGGSSSGGGVGGVGMGPAVAALERRAATARMRAVEARRAPEHTSHVAKCLRALGYDASPPTELPLGGALPLDLAFPLGGGDPRIVGVVVEPEESHSSNMKRPLGDTVLRMRLLAREGFIVLSVPYAELAQAQSMGDQWLEGHLERRVRRVVGWADENEQQEQEDVEKGGRGGGRGGSWVQDGRRGVIPPL